MSRFIVVVGFLVLATSWGSPAYSAPKAANGVAALAMSITQEASEEQRIADILERYAPLANYLSAAAGAGGKIGESRNNGRESGVAGRRVEFGVRRSI